MTGATHPHDLDSARIEALLNRLDPAASAACTVPGCLHLDHGADEDLTVLRPAA